MGHRVYVAGAASMKGAAIVKALAARPGFEIVGTEHEPDMARPEALTEFFERQRPTSVIVAAGRAHGITGNQRYPAELIHQNLVIATNLIHAAWAGGVRRLLYLASSCTYPKLAPQPMKPEYLLTGSLEPTNQAYAAAKLAGIEMCNAYRKQYGVEFFTGIPADVFGPGDNFDPEDSHVIAGLLRRMHKAKLAKAPALDIWGSGRQRREFLYIDDLASAAVFALDRYDASAGTINLGGGRDTSIAELAEAVRKVVGYAGELRFDTSKPDGMPFKALDSTALLSLGWRPEVPFEAGLRRTYLYFLERVPNHAGA